MAQLSRIKTRIRSLIDDLSEIHPGDSYTISTAGSSVILTLSESNAIAISSVTLNGATLSASTYVLSGTKITITTTLTVDDAIVIVYTFYPMYSETDLKSYITASFTYISLARIANFRIDDSASDVFDPIPTEKQENLIALITATIIEPDVDIFRTSAMSKISSNKKSKNQKIDDIIYAYRENVGVFS